MEDFKVRSCRICLTVVRDGDYQVLDNNSNDFAVHLLKLDFDDSKLVMCNACSAKLFAAQEFKTACIYTDNVINRYVSDTTVPPLDLRDIYMEEGTNGQVSIDAKICRLCMQPIKNDAEFKSIDEEQVDMIHTVVPGMNIFIIKEPVMCHLCQDSLAVHCNFFKECSDVEQSIGYIPYRQEFDVPSPVTSVNISVKMEEVDIKIEDIQQSTESECVKEIKIESEVCGPEILLEYAASKYRQAQCAFGNYKIASVPFSNKVVSNRKHERYDSESDHQAPFEKHASKLQRYKCENCNYETKASLTRHMLVHKDPPEVQIYKCEHCTFENKLEDKRKYKDPSEVQMYKYETCDYATKRKTHLKNHMSIHEDSVVQIYKCFDCNYETQYKRHLVQHMLLHKDPSEVQTYKCGVCSYETKYKSYLKIHNLKHLDTSQVQMYKCEKCNYENKNKTYFKRHLLIHKDPSQLQKYKCENCNFETKCKEYLKRHFLVHQDPSEVQMYKCEMCNYESKFKHDVSRHTLVHKNPSEVQMYKCETCNYVTKDKYLLRRHSIIHKDPSQVQMYKCEHCDYESKFKRGLNRHMVLHKDPSEVKMHICITCNYATKEKRNLKRHMTKHSSFGDTNLQIGHS